MAKIVELESGVDPVEEITDPKQAAKNETEEMIQRLMQKAYVLGLSAGMKTMCGSVLEKMKQNKNLNPQKQLMLLRQWCNHNLSISSKSNNGVKHRVDFVFDGSGPFRDLFRCNGAVRSAFERRLSYQRPRRTAKRLLRSLSVRSADH